MYLARRQKIWTFSLTGRGGGGGVAGEHPRKVAGNGGFKVGLGRDGNIRYTSTLRIVYVYVNYTLYVGVLYTYSKLYVL